MRNDLKRLIVPAFIGLFPAILLLTGYIYFDPFKVLRDYDSYFDTSSAPNRDYVSTEMFLKNISKYQYNSFIFGSSRAIAFHPDSWLKYLENNAVPFIFDASGETLFGIYTKLKFIEKQGVELHSALIIFCRDGIFNAENSTSHLAIKHPQVSNESTLQFHFTFIKTYFKLEFLLGYYYHKLTGKRNSLTKGIIPEKVIPIDPVTNQIILDDLETEVINDPGNYYSLNSKVLYERTGEKYEPLQEIKEKHLLMLNEIKNILERNNTDYRIVLSPMYDQVKFSQQDKSILKKIYGNHLYDFTGENFITRDITNWYENNHYRPFIADSIMSIIYSGVDNNQWR